MPSLLTDPQRVSGIDSPCLYHRKRKTLPVKALRLVEAQMHVSHLQIRHLLADLDVEGVAGADAQSLACACATSDGLGVGTVVIVISAETASAACPTAVVAITPHGIAAASAAGVAALNTGGKTASSGEQATTGSGRRAGLTTSDPTLHQHRPPPLAA